MTTAEVEAKTETATRPPLYSDVVVVCEERNENGDYTQRTIWGKVRPLTIEDFLPYEWEYKRGYRSETEAVCNLILRPELEAEMLAVGLSVSGHRGLTDRCSDWSANSCPFRASTERTYIRATHTRKTIVKGSSGWRNTKSEAQIKAQWDAAIARHKQELGEADENAKTNNGVFTREYLINRALEKVNYDLAKNWEGRRYDAVRVVGEHFSRLSDKDTPADDLARLNAIRKELAELREKREALSKESDEIVRRCTRERLAQACADDPEEFRAAVTDALAKARAQIESDLFHRL
jgi:hypothetical protein